MSVQYLNEIISIFLQRDMNELRDDDLSRAIGAKGIECSTQDIHVVVQSFGSSLFQLRRDNKGAYLVRIEPKINICRDFLIGKCSSQPGGCNQLHLCRSFGHCRKKGCHFPHDLNGRNNRRIVERSNCQNVDRFLLIPLIQLYNRSSHHSFQNPPTTRSVVPKPTNTASSSEQPEPVQWVFERTDRTRLERASRDELSNTIVDRDNRIQSTSNTNYLIDVSFPSTSSASHITIETIEEFLRFQGLAIQKRFNSKTNDTFHRWTLQFEENSAVNDLLTRSVIPYRGFHLKFKRTNLIIDSKSFILQSTIDLKKGPISIEKFSSYIDILVDRCLYKLTDLSSSLEQILLIQCNKMLDFGRLCAVQKSRRQVQGRNVSLKQVYEIETAVIESIQTSLSSIIVQNIVESVYENVFTLTVVSNQTALVEFIHADALKQWLSNSDVTKQKFNVDIKPSIKCVDEDDRNCASRRSSASQSIKSKIDNTTSQVTVNFPPQWAMVAGHSKFGIEYKDYIRSETGFEIDIRGNQVQIHCTPTSDTFPKEDPSSLLNDRTNNFMRKFAFRSISLQQPKKQLAILRTHSSTVAFRRKSRNTYLLAARSSNVLENLMQKLLPEKPFDNKPIYHPPPAASAAQGTTKSVDQKQTSTFVIPPPLVNSMCIEEIITKNMALPTNTPAQVALFSDKTVENYLQIYFNKTYNTKLNIELTTGNNRYPIVKIVGKQNSVDDAFKELQTLISLFRTKTFDEMTGGGWVKISDVTCVIRHRFNLLNIICVCQQQTSPISILVHHIDATHNKLGVSEQVIETLCRRQLVLFTCKSIGFEKEWTTLKTEILKCGDYGKDICLIDEQQIITFYGLPHVISDIRQRVELIKKKTERSYYVPIVDQSEPIKSEKSRNLNVEHPLQSTVIITRQENNQMTQKAQTRSIVFQIDEPGFEVLINQDFNQVSAIVDSKFSLEKQIIHHHIQIQIPKAKVNEFDANTSDVQPQNTKSEPPNDSNKVSPDPKTNWFLGLFQRNTPKTEPPKPTSQVSSTASSNNAASINIGKSKIIVCTGDLTKQAVDLIVVCSTSKILCDAITSAAGFQVQNEYNQQSSIGMLAFETSGGNLPCKHIIFRPWNYLHDLKHLIDVFVTSIITYAIHHNFTTIAFPSIGCGQLGHDPKIIAEHMIGETYRLLKISLQSQLIISFVLLPEQKNVYDAFADQLNMMKSIDDTPTSISFDKQTVKITLTGSDDNGLTECQNKIKELARSYSCKLHLTDQKDMADWPQDIIQKYYEYCLQNRIIPTLDIDNSILDLTGPKYAVSDAEKYYLQLTTETLRNARIQVISRGIVWSVEVASGKWESYSYKINEQIENAQMKNLLHVDFMNEKSERCRVIFSNMEEQYQQRKRRVSRKRIDSSLPNNWDSSDGNFKRVVLLDSSKEYKDVLNRFDTTMRGQYWKIVNIVRIQNQRWYKQYAAHRDEFTQRHKQPDERLLFHDCGSTSADKIVQECFNRSFAGAHGIVYGCGVYFHEHAKYSHSYTQHDISGERTMFLARVLIGKKCLGNPSMKVPPEGFDTTTDGGHIFVVYHDAAAYGEYLIIYK